jgi:hypothetical protein
VENIQDRKRICWDWFWKCWDKIKSELFNAWTMNMMNRMSRSMLYDQIFKIDEWTWINPEIDFLSCFKIFNYHMIEEKRGYPLE